MACKKKYAVNFVRSASGRRVVAMKLFSTKAKAESFRSRLVAKGKKVVGRITRTTVC